MLFYIGDQLYRFKGWAQSGFPIKRISQRALSGKLLVNHGLGDRLQYISLEEKHPVLENAEKLVRDFVLTENLQLLPSRREILHYSKAFLGPFEEGRYIGRLNYDRRKLYLRSASISPDGLKLAFILYEHSKSVRGVLYVLTTVAAKPIAVFKEVYSNPYETYSRISWVPDSTELLFNKNYSELYIYDFKNNSLNKFAEGRDGAWSPDGKEIACSSKDGSHLVVRKETGELIAAFKVIHPMRITWSPDKKYLAYLKGRGPDIFSKPERMDLEISNIAGSSRRIIECSNLAPAQDPFLLWVK